MAGGMKPRPPFIPHVPFDLVLAEPAFPPVESASTEQDEAMLNVRISFSRSSILTNTHVQTECSSHGNIRNKRRMSA